MVCDGWPNTYFVFGRMGGTCPGHAKHAGDEQEVVATKKARSNQKEEAGQETQHGKHARNEDAGNEHVGNAQTHPAKEAHCAKEAAHYKTSNGQYAWDEDARNEDAGDSDVAYAKGFTPTDEHARDEHASG